MNLDYNYVLEFASKKHAGQFRADGVTPYIEHPKKVAELVQMYKKSSQMDVLVAAALLHDTIEDTYTSYKELEDEFGEIVASLVLELTTASYYCRFMGKAQYLERKMANMSSYALVIKLADRLANIMDSVNLPLEKQKNLYHQTKQIINYLKFHKKLSPSHKRLIKAIKEELEVLRSTIRLLETAQVVKTKPNKEENLNQSTNGLTKN